MKNKIVKKDLTKIIRKARKEALNDGREIAGLLIHNGYFIELIETKNISTESGHFQFDEEQIKTIMKATKVLNHEIVGTLHSHPMGLAKPGTGDIKAAVDDSLMLIIDCTESNAQLWRISGGKARQANMELIEL